MKWPAITLIATGSALLAVSAWLSFSVGVITEHHQVTNDYVLDVQRNIWGQTVSATATSKKNNIEIVETGPYLRDMRQGLWSRMTYIPNDEGIQSLHWYIDNHEVSQTDWKAGRKPPRDIDP